MKKTRFLTALLAGLTIGFAGLVQANADEKTTLVVMIRGLDNPYHAYYYVGAKALGAALGLPVDVLSSEGNSQKQFGDLKAEIAKTGGNMVLNVDPNEAPDVVPIAKMLEDAGVYWVNWWNKPDDVKVQSYPHWVAHIGFDAVEQGNWNANELFKTFKTPYKGQIVAIQGMLSNNAGWGRFQGLQNAMKEHPDVKLLQWLAADWDANKAYDAAKQLLAAHPDVDGVWSANDMMVIGAMAALKEDGLAGKVMISGIDGSPEAYERIEEGVQSSTEFMDSRYQAELGLSMALAAKEGKLDVKAIPPEHRAFLIAGVHVTKDNVKDFIEKYIKVTPTYDLKDFWSKWVAAIPDAPAAK